MADRISPEERSRNMRQIRADDTKPERRVRTFLHRAGLRFRLHRRDLPGVPDIVLPRLRAVVFVHGCFWHQHSACRDGREPTSNRTYWSAKLAKNRERDSANQKLLKRLGWRVFVIWECEIDEKRLKQLLRGLQRIQSRGSQEKLSLPRSQD